MARHKHIRNPHDYPIDVPTLVPALHLEPGQVARVPSEVDLPGVEIVTAKDADGEAPLHTLTEPDRRDDPWVGAPATVLAPEPAPELPATATIEEPTP